MQRGGLSAGRRFPAERAGVWPVRPWPTPASPRPGWVDGTQLCAGSCCSKPPTRKGRLQLREPRGAQAAPGPGQTTGML